MAIEINVDITPEDAAKGYRASTATKRSNYNKEWYKAHRDERMAYSRQRYKDKKELIKTQNISYNLRRKYGITSEQKQQKFVEQGSCCAICKSTVPSKNNNWNVDHCHTSGKVRGILCHDCNVGIGHFKDNTEFLKSSIAYLEKHNG